MRRAKVERVCLARAIRILAQCRRVHPPLLLDRVSFRPDVLLVVVLGALEGASGESLSGNSRLARLWQSLRHHLCDSPVHLVTGAARQLFLVDLDIAVLDRDEVARRQDFDVDDGQDAVVDVVVVGFAGDDFLADLLVLCLDRFVGDCGCLVFVD